MKAWKEDPRLDSTGSQQQLDDATLLACIALASVHDASKQLSTLRHMREGILARHAWVL